MCALNPIEGERGRGKVGVGGQTINAFAATSSSSRNKVELSFNSTCLTSLVILYYYRSRPPQEQQQRQASKAKLQGGGGSSLPPAQPQAGSPKAVSRWQPVIVAGWRPQAQASPRGTPRQRVPKAGVEMGGEEQWNRSQQSCEICSTSVNPGEYQV